MTEPESISNKGYIIVSAPILKKIYIIDKKLYKQLLATIKIGVLKNYKEAGEEWEKYDNPFETYFKKVYDLFLKANNQPKGIKTYSYMVALMVNYFDNRSL